MKKSNDSVLKLHSKNTRAGVTKVDYQQQVDKIVRHIKKGGTICVVLGSSTRNDGIEVWPKDGSIMVTTESMIRYTHANGDYGERSSYAVLPKGNILARLVRIALDEGIPPRFLLSRLDVYVLPKYGLTTFDELRVLVQYGLEHEVRFMSGRCECNSEADRPTPQQSTTHSKVIFRRNE